MKKTKNLALLFPFLLAGCGGGGGGNKEIVLSEAYQERAGDVFTTFTTTKFTLRGESSELNVTDVKTYAIVDSIPAKYNYSQSSNGPFILETSTDDGFLDGLRYSRMSGGSIIDDDLSNFTNIEYSNRIGGEDPENVFVGDKFSFHANETLFSSISGDEVGYEITSMDFTVLQEEQLSVPAGVFNAVKIRTDLDMTTSLNDIIITTALNGYMWIGTENGFMLKIEATDAVSTRGDQDLTVTFSAETVLQSYSLGEGSSVKRNKGGMVRVNQFGLNVNPNKIFNQIHANLKFNTKEILEKKD